MVDIPQHRIQEIADVPQSAEAHEVSILADTVLRQKEALIIRTQDNRFLIFQAAQHVETHTYLRDKLKDARFTYKLIIGLIIIVYTIVVFSL